MDIVLNAGWGLGELQFLWEILEVSFPSGNYIVYD